jgi:hypothetical protein
MSITSYVLLEKRYSGGLGKWSTDINYYEKLAQGRIQQETRRELLAQGS